MLFTNALLVMFLEKVSHKTVHFITLGKRFRARPSTIPWTKCNIKTVKPYLYLLLKIIKNLNYVRSLVRHGNHWKGLNTETGEASFFNRLDLFVISNSLYLGRKFSNWFAVHNNTHI